MQVKFDMSWGESVCVRKAFIEVCNTLPIKFDNNSLNNLGYPVHEGDLELVELTKKIIKRQIGKRYDFVLITNGATGGVTVSLRALHAMGYKYCTTYDPPYFRLYPGMIEASGLIHSKLPNEILLIDSPSNPLGKFSEYKKDSLTNKVIWDSVYYSKVYCPGKHIQPNHDILVGSYSKFTGLNGLRVGWIATNDGLLYERMKYFVISEYCGISVASSKIILETAGKFTIKQWELFENKASNALDYNREEWSKLENYFSGIPITKVGMFYYTPIDRQMKKLLEKSGVIWSPGSSLWHTDEYGRFNLGQDINLVKSAVKEILKNDRQK